MQTYLSLKDIWENGLAEDWLICESSHKLPQLSQEVLKTLTPQSVLLLAETEPVKFLAGFMAAVAANCPVFLCNPYWVEAEWQQVFHLVQPDPILGQTASLPFPTPTRSLALPVQEGMMRGAIMIPTGGSSGKIRFAIHTWETLMASVRGFGQYFGKEKINSFCVLPLYHVSGLMQFLRSFTTGGNLVIRPFKSIPSEWDINVADFFISLVPTQLQRLLEKHSSWLSRFETVLLGGAPAWDDLLSTARNCHIPLALTYGMTETASGIVTLKPADFLAGKNNCGRVLPHANVTIRSPAGKILGLNQTGAIAIDADSLTLGYYGRAQQHFQPDDLGYFDSQGYLHLVGRQSNKIITGGENVFPAEVEGALLATQLVSDVCAIGLSDAQWGQVVTVVYVPKDDRVSIDRLQGAIADKLSKYKRPKHWVTVESLPRNEQGKINRELLKQIALAKIKI